MNEYEFARVSRAGSEIAAVAIRPSSRGEGVELVELREKAEGQCGIDGDCFEPHCSTWYKSINDAKTKAMKQLDVRSPDWAKYAGFPDWAEIATKAVQDSVESVFEIFKPRRGNADGNEK